jgi:hypothetical protein
MTHSFFETTAPVIFTGDVGGVRIGTDSPVMPPCPPPDINVEDWMDSIALLESRDAEHLFLTHYGLISDKKAHLGQLSRRLQEWAAWIKPYFEANTPPAEIVPQFEAWVEQQLRAEGVNEADIERYNKANPAFMSVAGLLRYWKKRTQS